MKRLKELRIEKGLSQQKLANHLGISQQSVYKYENNIAEPDISTLKNLADFFETSVDYLIEYSDIPQKCVHYTETDLDKAELELIRNFRRLSSSKRRIISQLIIEMLK